MRIFKDVILKICAACIFIIGVALILGSVEIINLNKFADSLITFVSTDEIKVIISASVICILTLIGIFVSSDNKDDIKTGVAIKRETGNVYISKETFESIIINIAKTFASLKNYKVTVLIKEDGITANILTYILADTVVPTLTSKLQEDIKNAILKQTTVEMKEINVKIKGVYEKQDKTVS